MWGVGCVYMWRGVGMGGVGCVLEFGCAGGTSLEWCFCGVCMLGCVCVGLGKG